MKLHKIAKSKKLSIEVRVETDILFKDEYSQRQITNKLKISRHGVQYSSQRQLRIGTNVNRKKAKTPIVTITAKDKHLIIDCPVASGCRICQLHL